jgi:hypothetical protein
MSDDDEDFSSSTTKKGTFNKEKQYEDLKRIAETEDIDELISISNSEDPLVR